MTSSALVGLARQAGQAMMAQLGVGSVLVLMLVGLWITQDQFGTYGNFINILETNAALLVVSIGLTLVLLAGGFDLSVGGMIALSSVLLATLITGAGVSEQWAIAIVIVGSVLVGIGANGLPIAKLGLSFFVVTIGTMSIFRGVALVVTQAETQGLYDQTLLREIGSGRVRGVPWQVVIAGVVLVGALLVTRYTGYGRMIYAVGGNADAARLAGINVVSIRMSTYAISAGLAGLAGVMLTGRLAAAEPSAGTGIELTAAAAVLLGGTSFVGGSGGMFGTLLGVLFLGVLSNGLTLSGISSFWQGVISGTVLVAAVFIDRFRRKAG